MLFFIAETLGRMVWELEKSMPFSEFVEWCAYQKIKQRKGGEESPFEEGSVEDQLWNVISGAA